LTTIAAEPEPQSDLKAMEELLTSAGFKLAKAITDVTAVTEADKITKDLVTIFEDHGLTVALIDAHVAREVKEANHAGSLMRANSAASKLMKAFSLLIGKPFLAQVLGPSINAICANPDEGGASFEVDPSKISPTDDLAKNREKLQSTCSKMLRTILDSVDDTPLEFRAICTHLQRSVTAKFAGSGQVCIGGFMFLRYFCPAMVTPSTIGITKAPPNPAAQRGLTLIAKTLQNVANNVTFGKKEDYFVFLNTFISDNFSACQDYFDAISQLPQGGVKASKGPGSVNPKVKEQALQSIVKHLRIIYPKLEEKYVDKEFMKKLRLTLPPPASVIGRSESSVDLIANKEKQKQDV